MSGLTYMQLPPQDNEEGTKESPFFKKESNMKSTQRDNEVKLESTTDLLTPINLFCSETMLQPISYPVSKEISFNEAEANCNTYISDHFSQAIPLST